MNSPSKNMKEIFIALKKYYSKPNADLVECSKEAGVSKPIFSKWAISLKEVVMDFIALERENLDVKNEIYHLNNTQNNFDTLLEIMSNKNIGGINKEFKSIGEKQFGGYSVEKELKANCHCDSNN